MIADTSSASRRRLAKTIVDLGGKMINIALVDSYEEAEQRITSGDPKVVLSDYYLGGRSGFDVFQKFRKQNEDAKDTLLVLITANSSQSAVARAAEEDVDTFILKPYTLDSFRATLIGSAIEKLFPNEYKRNVDKGKLLLFGGKIDEAMQVFEQAMKMDPSPSLACYYYGQAETMRQGLEDAKGSFQKGLTFNGIHYKCLVGLYDLFMSQSQFEEAYSIVRRVAKYFPANPKRLSSVIHLAIRTGNWADMESYYELFISLDVRDPEVTRSTIAGMIVAAKYFMREKKEPKGMTLLQKAAVSCAGDRAFLRRIIEAFCEFKKLKEAEETLSRFAIDDQNGSDFKAARYAIEDVKLDAAKSAEVGANLIQQGVQVASTYDLVIRRMIEAGMKERATELATKAIQTWPGESRRFSVYLPPDKSAA